MFQSTHPHGVRLALITAKHTTRTVSIHAPTRGATSSSHCSWSMRLCFNPRTHTGCDTAIQGHTYSISEFQSTHPHGVRHRRGTRRGLGTRVSIHAPTRGATTLKVSRNDELLFQSTHPHGVRQLYKHTRATIASFNPRTHTGCDLCTSLLPIEVTKFQSTHPHGVRLLRLIPRLLFACFNPRTHTGCDVTPMSNTAALN